ncbi:MAG TPA: hypothetical protein VF111_14325, partial [Thermoanaerobaculia bacterium]
MKRSLLLVVLTLLVLAVPTTASACDYICESAFRPCVYEVNTDSYCEFRDNVCWMTYFPCRSGNGQQDLLSAKYQIASVEIERFEPVETRDSAVRVASNVDPTPQK